MHVDQLVAEAGLARWAQWRGRHALASHQMLELGQGFAMVDDPKLLGRRRRQHHAIEHRRVRQIAIDQHRDSHDAGARRVNTEQRVAQLLELVVVVRQDERLAGQHQRDDHQQSARQRRRPPRPGNTNNSSSRQTMPARNSSTSSQPAVPPR